MGFYRGITCFFLCLQWIKNSEELSFTLLEPWFKSMGWTAQHRSNYVKEHKWLLVGFCLPFSLLNSIPIINVAALGAAQSSAAILVAEALAPNVPAGFHVRD